MKIEILGMGCPKCNNLVKLAQETATELELSFEIVKITQIKDIMNYGVMTIPALAINGEVVVAGRIPAKEEMKKWLLENQTK
jgi:small redox-active disulfide protein 2